MAFRCTNCNGDIRFDIESQLMKCDHCGSTFDPDSFRVRNVSDEEVLQDQGLTLFLCSGCGAELQGTEESEVGFCPYCGGQSSALPDHERPLCGAVPAICTGRALPAEGHEAAGASGELHRHLYALLRI